MSAVIELGNGRQRQKVKQRRTAQLTEREKHAEKLLTQKKRNTDRHRQRLVLFSAAVIALCSVEGLGGSNCDVDTHLHSSQLSTLQPTVLTKPFQTCTRGTNVLTIEHIELMSEYTPVSFLCKSHIYCQFNVKTAAAHGWTLCFAFLKALKK